MDIYDSVHIIGLEMHFHQKGDLLEIFCSLQNLAVVIVRSVIILSLSTYLFRIEILYVSSSFEFSLPILKYVAKAMFLINMCCSH